MPGSEEGTPSYPPSHNTWEVGRRPPRPRGPIVLAVLVVLVAACAVTGVVAVVVVASTARGPGTIDDDQLTRVIATQCEIMTATVEASPVDGTAQRQSATILDQNRAVEAMVAAIRVRRTDEIRGDRPAEQWLADWDRLVEARAALARRLLTDPNASLVVPLDRDGDPIVERMDAVWPGDPVCVVPPMLAAPDSDALSG